MLTKNAYSSRNISSLDPELSNDSTSNQIKLLEISSEKFLRVSDAPHWGETYLSNEGICELENIFSSSSSRIDKFYTMKWDRLYLMMMIQFLCCAAIVYNV